MARKRRVPAARLESAEAVIAVGDRVSYSIVNTGSVPLMYGFDGSIEWRQHRRWIPLPLGGWVAAVGKRIEPGQRSDVETYELTQHLVPGNYRLAKRLSSVDVIPSTGFDRDPLRFLDQARGRNLSKSGGAHAQRRKTG